jgi:peroxiredoxin
VGTNFVIGEKDPGIGNAVVGKPYTQGETLRLKLDATQRWCIGTRNGGNIGATHPFHLHVNPFEVVAVRDPNQKSILKEPVWRDTLAMQQGYTYEILMKYADFRGSFVQHCHVLDHEDRGMMRKITIEENPPSPTPPPVAATSTEPIDLRPSKPGGVSVALFVKGSYCPHCMAQVATLAQELVDRDIDVAVVSASSPEDLADFPSTPFRLIADPGHELFKAYHAFDGEPRHATLVIDSNGVELFRDDHDEPLTDFAPVIQAIDGAVSKN